MKLHYERPEVEQILFRALEAMASETSEPTEPNVELNPSIGVGGGVDQDWGANSWTWSGDTN